MKIIRPHPRSRRGITSALAMLYLVLFSVLALGFYATVTTAVQISGNESHVSRSLQAADSGIAFMKYHLANLGIPAGTDSSQLFSQVYSCLQTRLATTTNNSVALTVGLSADGKTITIPGSGDPYVWLDTNKSSGFKVTIQQDTTNVTTAQQLVVKVFGKYGTTTTSQRGIKLNFDIAENAANIFDYGIASKSAISMNGNTTVKGIDAASAAMGSVLTTTTKTNPPPLSMTGSAVISGEASFAQANPPISVGTSSTIAGLKPTDPNFGNVINTGVTGVEFPVINTSDFVKYAPSASAPAGTTGVITDKNPAGTYFKNIRIKANTNPSFNANTTVEGVVVIEKPNQVKFAGGTTIRGIIVSETPNPTTDKNNESWDTTANTISFTGNVSYQSIDQLPDNNQTDFPDSMQSLKGSFVLAPGFAVDFGGNFGTVGGSVIASGIDFHGSAGGVITGSVINLKDTAVSISGNSTIVIQSVGTSNYPAGVYFGEHYWPLPNTYREVTQ